MFLCFPLIIHIIWTLFFIEFELKTYKSYNAKMFYGRWPVGSRGACDSLKNMRNKKLENIKLLANNLYNKAAILTKLIKQN